MKESNFQFKNPILKNLIFETNKFEKSTGTVKMSNELTVNVAKHESEPQAIVNLTIKIGSHSNDSPFYLEAVVVSEFKWKQEAYDEDTIDTLLKINAPSLLLGYARPIVANVTNASAVPAYNIPFIDFTCE